MIRRALIAHRRVRHDDMADGDLRVEHSRAAACDELARTERDRQLEHRRRDRSADPRMHHGKPAAIEIELVNRMIAGFPTLGVNLARAIAHEVVDHVLEKAEHAVFGDVEAFIHAARLDDRSRRGIVLDDREGASQRAASECAM